MTLAELNIEKVPSVPQVLLELLNLFHQPDVDFGRIGETIERDPAISAKILHFARTPFYRPWARVSSIRRLIVVLGADEVRQIALTSAIHQYFSSLSPDFDGFVAALWVRSLLCANLARELAQVTGATSQEDAYTAGLLHRVGQLVLLHNFPEKYLDVLFMDAPDSLREQTEKALFGTCHSEVGATLIRDWPLHPFVADAALYQNAVQETLNEASSLVQVLNLAGRLTDIVIRGSSEGLDWNDPFFGLNTDLLKEVAANSRKAVVDAGRHFDLQVESYLGSDRPAPKTDKNRRVGERQRLADYVYQSALVGGSQADPAVFYGKKEALQRIRRELAIVFGLHDIHFLLCDEESGRLAGISDENDLLPLVEFSLDPKNSASLAAQSLRDERPRCTLENHAAQRPGATIDEQMMRLLDTKGVLYLPLVSEGALLGVAVVGVTEVGWQSLSTQMPLLRLFLAPLSRLLLHTQRLIDQLERQNTEKAAFQQLEIRKIIHEVNNPLSVVTNYLYTLSTRLDENHAAGEDIAVIREEIARIGDILARLKDIGQSDQHDGSRLVLNRVIKDLLRLFEDTFFLEQNIQVETDLDAQIPPLALSQGAVKQLLINLLKNAGEAMTAGGKLHISTRDRVYKEGNLYVELQISDNGPGLPEAVLRSLFQPVASTKANHAGLGLTIVKNLVDNFSGEISCASRPHGGTRFQILLPRQVDREGGDS